MNEFNGIIIKIKMNKLTWITWNLNTSNWMNEWMNEWMDEWVNEWNAYIKEISIELKIKLYQQNKL